MALTAQRIEKRRIRRRAGLETLVDLAAIVMLDLGFVASLIVLLILIFVHFTWMGLVMAIALFLNALLDWLLLRCLAEHLRLQKKIAGCEYEGAITGPVEETIWSCGNCGQIVHTDNRCDACGARLTGDASE